jgi:hypothetical protein
MAAKGNPEVTTDQLQDGGLEGTPLISAGSWRPWETAWSSFGSWVEGAKRERPNRKKLNRAVTQGIRPDRTAHTHPAPAGSFIRPETVNPVGAATPPAAERTIGACSVFPVGVGIGGSGPPTQTPEARR